MVSDFGFAILDILYLLAHDSGEYTLKVINEGGEASTSTTFEVAPKEGILTQPLVGCNPRAYILYNHRGIFRTRKRPKRFRSWRIHFIDDQRRQNLTNRSECQSSWSHCRPQSSVRVATGCTSQLVSSLLPPHMHLYSKHIQTTTNLRVRAH